MVVGEEKTKVLNIVKPNVAHFRELYGSILRDSPQVVYKTQQGRLEVNCAETSIVSKTRTVEGKNK
jgi:translocator assembly and maintenance protein 41